jgi:hypothetical protein
VPSDATQALSSFLITHYRGEFVWVQVRGPGFSCLRVRPRFQLPPAPVRGVAPNLNPGLAPGTLIRVRRRHNPWHARARGPPGSPGYNPGLLSALADYNSLGNRTCRRTWPTLTRTRLLRPGHRRLKSRAVFFRVVLKTPFFFKKKRRVEALNSILKTPFFLKKREGLRL